VDIFDAEFIPGSRGGTVEIGKNLQKLLQKVY